MVFFSLLIIGRAKKRYISKIILREGNLMNPPKSDIKGFDFKKATCSEYAEKVFMNIINTRILNLDSPDFRGIKLDLMKFEDEIIKSIENRETRFLPNGNAKELGAYKDPASEIGVRGALAWNMLNTENQIEFPTKLSILKLNIFKLEDAEPLKTTHPDIYKIIEEKIFNDKTGFFVVRKDASGRFDFLNEMQEDWLNIIPKKYKSKFKNKTIKDWNDFVDANDMIDPLGEKGDVEIQYRGLQALGIPGNADIPEWVLPYIDYTSMRNNILAPFNSVLELFNNKFISEGKSTNGVNRKTNKATNIIKF